MTWTRPAARAKTSWSGSASSRSPRRPFRRSAPALHGAVDVAVGLALRDVAALVAQLLAARDGELGFDLPVLEVEARRDERQALLADHAVERIDLTAVREQLARPVGIVRAARPAVVRRDVQADEPELAVAHV